MSETLSVGVVGPGYWGFTASAMADHLEHVVREKSTDPDGVLPGVYRNAKRFFSSVLEATEEAMPDNPCATLANYKIATDTVMECLQPAPTDRAQVNQHLVHYAEFLERLMALRALEPDELKIATEVRDFFAQLARDGEEEDYLEAVRFDVPQLGLKR